MSHAEELRAAVMTVRVKTRRTNSSEASERETVVKDGEVGGAILGLKARSARSHWPLEFVQKLDGRSLVQFKDY